MRDARRGCQDEWALMASRLPALRESRARVCMCVRARNRARAPPRYTLITRAESNFAVDLVHNLDVSAQVRVVPIWVWHRVKCAAADGTRRTDGTSEVKSAVRGCNEGRGWCVRAFVCVCVCVCARACTCVCVRACVRVCLSPEHALRMSQVAVVAAAAAAAAVVGGAVGPALVSVEVRCACSCGRNLPAQRGGAQVAEVLLLRAAPASATLAVGEAGPVVVRRSAWAQVRACVRARARGAPVHPRACCECRRRGQPRGRAARLRARERRQRGVCGLE